MLQQFDLDIKCKKGSDNKIADALSWSMDKTGEADQTGGTDQTEQADRIGEADQTRGGKDAKVSSTHGIHFSERWGGVRPGPSDHQQRGLGACQPEPGDNRQRGSASFKILYKSA